MGVTQQSQPLHIENTVNALAREDLRLPQAFYTYRNMLQDEYIGGGINLVKSLLNKQAFHYEATPETPESERAYVEALNESLHNLNGLSMTQFLNYCLSCMEYGIALFETVIERKEGRNVFKTFSPIHPKDVAKYVFKGNVLQKLVLNPAENDGVVDGGQTGEQIEISGKKVIMIRLNPDLDNPLGRSVLQRCYTVWKSKQIASEYELIGISKDLSGTLKIKAPSEYINDYYQNPSSANAQYIDSLLTQSEMLHAGKVSQVLVASDTQENGVSLFDVSLISDGGSSKFDVNQTIERYNKAMLITLYTDILALGNGANGSYSLASSKTSLLGLFMESLQNAIREGIHQALEYVHSIEGREITGEVVFEDVNEIDPEAFSRAWQRLAQGGVITPDENLEAWVRDSLNAPGANYEKRLNNPTASDDSERTEDDKEK